MSDSSRRTPRRRIESLDHVEFEARLREASRGLFPDRMMDDLEVQHLVRVVTECSMQLRDVYSEERILRIMDPGRGLLSGLVDRLLTETREKSLDPLQRVRRLPEDARAVGDKALFDHGLLGLRRVKGVDLAELGARAYRVAGEILELLAEDRRLRRFFAENRLLVLPLEEEVVFLHQCSEKFRLHADILRRVQDRPAADSERGIQELANRVPLMAAAAEALTGTEGLTSLVEDATETPESSSDPYLRAARGGRSIGEALSKEQQLATYERILLFSALDMERLREALRSTVIDQERAVDRICDEFSLFAAGTRDQRKPPAYFLVGPTGVGKNHLVESLCRLLEGVWRIDVPILTIEGPSYTYPSDINELRGATRGFIRSDEDGILTAFHQKSSPAPLGVILIDEVEKAHPHLLTFFLSVLDRGTTTDNRGNVLNFSNCMMFFTSNLGYSDAQQEAAPIGYMDEESRQRVSDTDIRRALRGRLKPEFVNRVRIMHFDRLSRASVERILDLEFERIALRYREVHGLELALTPSARSELILRGFSPVFGARHLASTLEALCNVEIAKKVRQDDQGKADRGAMLDWIREMRAGERVFDAEGVRQRVMQIARAQLDYDLLRIVFRDGTFEFVGARTGGSG